MTANISVTIETAGDREVIVTRAFNAARQLVFDAFTKPDVIRKWYTAGTSEQWESDPRIGGSWRFVMARRGKTVGQYGVYKEVKAPEHFARTERWDDWDPGETLVTLDLAERGGQTLMTMSLLF